MAIPSLKRMNSNLGSQINDINNNINTHSSNITMINNKLDGMRDKIITNDIKCKNLLWTPYTEDYKSTFTANRSDHYIQTWFGAYLYPNTTYTASYQCDGATWDGDVELFICRDNNYGSSGWYIGSSRQSITFTPPTEGWYYIRYDNNAQGNTRSFYNFQIEEGSVATEWVQAQQFNNQQILSYAERRIGTWVNGKPLYSKTLRLDITTEDKQYHAHGIADVDIIFIDASKTYMGHTTDKATTPYWSIGLTGTDISYAYLANIQMVDQTNVLIRASTSNDYDIAYITLNYTKTTD